jgi:predicted 3-demethylubiquinone-9 3-methyltransferase (glyoxalase superfamily)
MTKNLQKITPNLWFDNQAEEAANFYVSIFKNSKIGDITRYGEAAGRDLRKTKRKRNDHNLSN